MTTKYEVEIRNCSCGEKTWRVYSTRPVFSPSTPSFEGTGGRLWPGENILAMFPRRVFMFVSVPFLRVALLKCRINGIAYVVLTT